MESEIKYLDLSRKVYLAWLIAALITALVSRLSQ